MKTAPIFLLLAVVAIAGCIGQATESPEMEMPVPDSAPEAPSEPSVIPETPQEPDEIIIDPDVKHPEIEFDEVNRSMWNIKAMMPTPRSEVAVATLGSKVLVIGGLENGGESNKVDIYNTNDDTWEEGTSLPAAVHHAAAVSFGTKLYLGKKSYLASHCIAFINMTMDRQK